MNAIQQEIQEAAGMSLDDFIAAYGEAPFELINGEEFDMPPQVVMSGRMGFRLARLLADFVDANKLGEVFIETPFVLTYDKSTWVKGALTPDVMFYSSTKMQQIQQDADWQSKPMIGIPDFVAEIISPTDTHIKVQAKRQHYLKEGVGLLWIVVPQDNSVTVYTQGKPTQPMIYNQSTDTLVGETVIPGFSLMLKDLFA